MADKVTVTIFGAKSLDTGEEGLLQVEVDYPEEIADDEELAWARFIFGEGVVAGVARTMQYYQPTEQDDSAEPPTQQEEHDE